MVEPYPKAVEIHRKHNPKDKGNQQKQHKAEFIAGFGVLPSDYGMHLAPGMAFSCEPGIYLKDDIGIRIEDVVIINEKGETEVLNHTSKELCELCVDD